MSATPLRIQYFSTPPTKRIMPSKAQPTALSEDQLNRYRITHPDRDIRPLIRRLHRIPLLGADDTAERDLTWLEVLKWKVSVERMMGGVEGLQKERDGYIRKAEETSARKVELEQRLEEEKVLLASKEKKRQYYIRCDEVAKRITDRGKTMAQLDEEIAAMEASLRTHKESYEQYLQVAESRVEIFNKISSLAEECKTLKLPVDIASSSSTIVLEVPDDATVAGEKGTNGKGKAKEEEGDRPEAMDVDVPSSSSGSRLNVQALPFQPTPSSSSTQSVPAPSTSVSTTSRIMKPPPSSLPVRPQSSTIPTTSSRLVPPAMSRSTSSSLPNRPGSTAVSGITKVKGLEEGELNDGGEDGEVIERASGGASGRGVKRGMTNGTAEGMRGVRTRK